MYKLRAIFYRQNSQYALQDTTHTITMYAWKKDLKKAQNKPMQTESEQVKGFCNWFFP